MENLFQTQHLQLQKEFASCYYLDSVPTVINPEPKQRLGHFAEAIFFEAINECLSDEQLLTNIQVVDQKITLGELDGLIVSATNVHHIEFSYKIYLLDPSLSESEFECWIGPNRRDSLQQKAAKIQRKQLPLLHMPETHQLLSKIIKDYAQLTLQQSVCILGQLYVPLQEYPQKKNYQYGTVDGFYIYFDELSQFSECLWWIPPTKKDWLLSPTPKVDWLSTEEFKVKLQVHYASDSNPLCWVKHPDGTLEKCFVVNWSGTTS